MKISELARATGSVLKTIRHHHEQQRVFSDLFNAYNTAGVAFPLKYTPIMNYFQRMCQFHAASALIAEEKYRQLEAIAETMVL